MNAKQIAQIVSEHHGRMYLVGGAVRDFLMQKKPNDFDYCVTGMSKEEFQNLFPEAVIRGKDFSVFDLYGIEIALARKERKINEGHQGFLIETNQFITIEEDLKRRDVTINSIAMDVLSGEIIDPFDGREDINLHQLKATSEAFSEDPLRVYRVARFASELQFKVEETTLNLMRSLKKELSCLSAERVFVEFRKTLCSSHPVTFFEVLKNCDCLEIHFEEIQKMIGIPQPKQYHPEGDVYCHTMEVLDRCAKETTNEYYRFAALVHDFGKIVTTKEILPHHYEHEKNGEKLIQIFCNRLKMPNHYKKVGITASKEHMKAGMFDELKIAKKVDFIVCNSKTVLGLEGLEILANCDKVRKDKIQFSSLGKKMLEEVNGKTMAMNDLSIEQLNEGMRQARIEWLTKHL